MIAALFSRFTRKPSAADAARALSEIGHAQHRNHVNTTARSLAAALGKTWPDDFGRGKA